MENINVNANRHTDVVLNPLGFVVFKENVGAAKFELKLCSLS